MSPYSAETPRAQAAKMPPPRRIIPALPLSYEKSARSKFASIPVTTVKDDGTVRTQRAATPDRSSYNSVESSPQNGMRDLTSAGAVPMTPESLRSSAETEAAGFGNCKNGFTTSEAPAMGPLLVDDVHLEPSQPSIASPPKKHQQTDTIISDQPLFNVPMSFGDFRPSPFPFGEQHRHRPSESHRPNSHGSNLPPPLSVEPLCSKQSQWLNSEANFRPFPPSFFFHGEPMTRNGSYSSHHSHSLSVPIGPALQSQSNIRPIASSTTLAIEAAVSLKDYLREQFDNMEFADFLLQISDPKTSSIPISVAVHGVFIARSPTLHALVKKTATNANTSSNGLQILPLTLTDKFITLDAFLDALRHLYGGPLLNGNDLLYGLLTPDFNSSGLTGPSPASSRLLRALAHAAAGHLLQLPMITLHGLECAKQLLRWDTVEDALAFALEGGLTSHWHARASSSLPAECIRLAGEIARSDIPLARYGEFVGQFLQNIVDFIASSVPNEFRFHVSAPELIRNPRLPIASKPRTSISNPYLSQIRFGEMESEIEGAPDFITSLISSILVSLPFQVLKATLEHQSLLGRLGLPKVTELAHAVVEERESRRLKSVKAKRTATNACFQVWDVAHGRSCNVTQVREQVGAGHGLSTLLTRSSTGRDQTDGVKHIFTKNDSEISCHGPATATLHASKSAAMTREQYVDKPGIPSDSPVAHGSKNSALRSSSAETRSFEEEGILVRGNKRALPDNIDDPHAFTDRHALDEVSLFLKSDESVNRDA